VLSRVVTQVMKMRYALIWSTKYKSFEYQLLRLSRA